MLSVKLTMQQEASVHWSDHCPVQRACRGTEEEVIKTGLTNYASIQGIGAMTSSKAGMSEGVQRLSGACAG